MKKIISVLVMICWFAMHGQAQGGVQPVQPGMQARRMGGELEVMKIAFITKRLNLTPDEAQRFWPVYNQYAAEVRQAHQAYRIHKDELILEQSILNSKKKYSPEFSKVLSPEKTNEFFRAEKDFGAFVQKEMQRRQMQMRRADNR